MALMASTIRAIGISSVTVLPGLASGQASLSTTGREHFPG